MKQDNEIILYTTGDGNVSVLIRFEDENFWMTQKAIAELFDVQVPAITKHLKNIYDEEELTREATVSKKETVQIEGSREVSRLLDFYNIIDYAELMAEDEVPMNMAEVRINEA